MSKIATYSLADSPLQLSDRLIGTEAPRPIPSATPLATKNFSLGELLQLFSGNFPAATLQAVLNAGNIATQNINLTGTINVDLIKPTNIEDMLGSIGTPLQVLSKGVGGICWIDIAVGAVWGNITGDIEDQTDLINYISSQTTIPDFQQVTNKGSSTTNQIIVGGITSGNLYSDGYSFGISDAFDYNFNLLYIPYTGLTLDDFYGNGTYLGYGNITLNDSSGNYINIGYGSITINGYSVLTTLNIDPTPTNASTNAVSSDGVFDALGTKQNSLSGTGVVKSTAGTISYINGTNSQYIRGDGTLATFPTTGTVTSVGLSMPSAFVVNPASNPITTSGTLTVTGAGTISQYIRGDGSLATFPNTPTLQQVVTAGNIITTAFTNQTTSSFSNYENTFNSSGIVIKNNSDGSTMYYQNNGIFYTKFGLQQSLVFEPFDGFIPTARTVKIPNADGTIALTSDIQILTEGKNINIVSDEIEVAIPPIVNTSAILGTTGDGPQSITIDSSGNIYTANTFSDNVTKITPSGFSSTLGSTGDAPVNITTDSSGNIYTTNILSDNVTKITPSGVSTTLGSTGYFPNGIVIDSLGNVYTANGGSDNVTKITPSGFSSTLGSTGSNPSGITIDSSGNIYTANTLSDNVTKITPSGVSTTLGSTGSVPNGIVIDSLGNVYTANTFSDNVTKITPSGFSSILGSTGDSPIDITIDSSGNIYTSNRDSNNVTKITPAGVSTTLGTAGLGPYGITIDALGNIYTSNINSDNVTKITVDNKRILAVDDNLNIIRVDGSGGGGGGTGTVTSIGLTVPSAFIVTPTTPITTSGTFAITGAGTASQYVRGDGQLATFPSGGGGGSSVNYYLNGSIAASVATYKQMSNTAIIGLGTDFPLTGNGLIAQFLTDVGNPNRLEIPGGAWNFEMFFSMSSGGGSPKFYVELLKYDGTTFTSIASTSATPETISGGTPIDLYLTSLAVPTTALLATDRLAIRVYIVDNSGGKTAKLHTEDSHLCEIITTFSTGLTDLNGLTSQTQYFDEGTSGTDFNISSISDIHTFNLPTASATNRGALSTTDWTTFNNKQNASTRRNANNSSNNNINYCGVALGTGVSESSAVWTITRLTIAASGSITTATATNVAWTNRESVIY